MAAALMGTTLLCMFSRPGSYELITYSYAGWPNGSMSVPVTESCEKNTFAIVMIGVTAIGIWALTQKYYFEGIVDLLYISCFVRCGISHCIEKIRENNTTVRVEHEGSPFVEHNPWRYSPPQFV